MAELKLSEDMMKWRAERPDEWTMDRFIRAAEKLERATIHNSEYVEINGTDWVCEKCGQTVNGRNVTFEETHEGCGGKCH